MKPSLLFITLITASGLSCAATGSVPDGPPPSGGPGQNPALDTAMKACASTVAKDASGRPDRTALDTCMTAKGFTKPAMPPGGAAPKSN